jgi:hypothetical protein
LFSGGPAAQRNCKAHRFLKAKKHLLNDMELLELEDLPGVRGLKALRVGINLENESLTLPVINIQTAV